MNVEPLVLVLDAMGVLYQSGDDVAELLVPFVHQHNPGVSAQTIDQAYKSASLGQMTSVEFWTALHVSPDLENEYLSQHCLTDGTIKFLTHAIHQFDAICCLSNDVVEWSLKLQKRFALEHWIDTWVISGDVGYRKPSQEIYLELFRQLSVEPEQILFVDDRPKNLDAAQILGIKTVLLDCTGCQAKTTHRCIKQLFELLS